MRLGEILFFSPKFRFCDLDLGDPGNVLDAFQDRVRSFYLDPARQLLNQSAAFAAGLVCICCIDFLARYGPPSRQESRIAEWLEQRIPEFRDEDPADPKRTLAKRFTKHFRNGLVHEGRIKRLGQFSLSHKEFIQIVGPAMMVHPGRLLDAVCRGFDEYCRELATNEDGAYERLVSQLRKDFGDEIAASVAEDTSG